MFWLAFEGSHRVCESLPYDYGRYPYRLRRARGFGHSNPKTAKNSFALNFLTVGPLQSPCGLVSTGIVTLTYI
jgi:hypothetical protein